MKLLCFPFSLKLSAVNPPILFTNTSTHQKETFTPINPGEVKLYSCGPTVWGPIHVGNLRAALTADLIFRFLKWMGYSVNYVRNYTDIDDKIINRAKEEGVTLETLTRKYIEEVEKDYAFAGLEEPTHKTKVTDHLGEINAMIQQILDRGAGYTSPDGEVFFEIDQFKSYGKLSRKPIEDLQAGVRVEVNPHKKNPLDFTLWKPAKSGEPSWPSPWGPGRPGWHIECSAMACKWLGNQMDIHHGGEDLIFPHHENEIAQSESATGMSPYAKIWLHNGFLNFSGEKMSKSLGNVVSARDFLSQFGAEVARMMFLSVHYRSMLNFDEQAVDQAIQGLRRIYEAKARAEQLITQRFTVANPVAEPAWGGFLIECDRARKRVREHFCNDLNTPAVIAEVFQLVREWNRTLAVPSADKTPGAVLGAQQLIQILEQDLGAVMGLGRSRSESLLNRLDEIQMNRRTARGSDVLTDNAVEALIQDRAEARKLKNFARSDEIREELKAKGVEILDSPQGTTWRRV